VPGIGHQLGGGRRPAGDKLLPCFERMPRFVLRDGGKPRSEEALAEVTEVLGLQGDHLIDQFLCRADLVHDGVDEQGQTLAGRSDLEIEVRLGG